MDGSGQPLRLYTHGLDLSGTIGGAGGIGGLLGVEVVDPVGGNQSLTPFYDGQGNLTQLVDLAPSTWSAGVIAAGYVYGAYGDVAASFGVGGAEGDNAYRFSTQPTDPVTALSRFHFRDYSPSAGRWTTRDPIGVAGGANVYAYVGNSPTNLIDPFGLDPFTRPPMVNPRCGRSSFILPRGTQFQGDPYSQAYEFVLDNPPDQLPLVGANPIPDFDPAVQTALHYAGNGVGAIAGIGEAALGIGLIVGSPTSGPGTPLVAAGGVLMTLHGADVANAALQNLWNGPGSNVQSLTSQNLTAATGNEQYAAFIEALAEVASGYGAARVLSRSIASQGDTLCSQVDEVEVLFNQGMRPNELADPALLKKLEDRGFLIDQSDDVQRLLNSQGANAATFGTGDILLRTDPRHVEVLEEWLHNVQFKIGLDEKLSPGPTGGLELHVKDFMLRHQRMLGISDEDAQWLREWLELANEINSKQCGQ